jgi:hypothetical protein
MQLMLAPDPRQFKTGNIRNLVERIYAEVYNRPPNDAVLQSFIGEVEDPA